MLLEFPCPISSPVQPLGEIAKHNMDRKEDPLTLCVACRAVMKALRIELQRKLTTWKRAQAHTMSLERASLLSFMLARCVGDSQRM